MLRMTLGKVMTEYECTLLEKEVDTKAARNEIDNIKLTNWGPAVINSPNPESYVTVSVEDPSEETMRYLILDRGFKIS